MEQGGMAISTMRFSEASRAERSCLQLLLFPPQILHLIPGAGAEIQHFSSRRVNWLVGWAGPDAGWVGAGFGAALGLNTEQEPGTAASRGPGGWSMKGDVSLAHPCRQRGSSRGRALVHPWVLSSSTRHCPLLSHLVMGWPGGGL